MALPECVVDLIEDRSQRAVGMVAEENAERVEAVPKNSRHRQKADRADVRLHPRVSQNGLDFATQIIRLA